MGAGAMGQAETFASIPSSAANDPADAPDNAPERAPDNVPEPAPESIPETAVRSPDRPRMVRREHLVRAFAGVAANVPLILVAAPAGYGKTTALSQWAREANGD